MNRSELLEAVNAEAFDRPEPALDKILGVVAEPVLDRILNVIAASLAVGESVSIRNFGKFEPRTHAPVIRKNPRTGEDIAVPEKQSVAFIPAPALKDRLNRVGRTHTNGSTTNGSTTASVGVSLAGN